MTEQERAITIHICGPSTATCRCNCPESCEHKWDGPTVRFENGASVTCSRCGMDAMSHSLMVMP
jgi:hypothetical protein